MKLWFNLLCRDIEAQMRFYQALLGLPEAEASRSPIYRALETADLQFGFNAQAAYAERLAPGALHASALPTATALLRLAPALLAAGGAVPASEALPRYIRDKVAQTTAERAALRAAQAASAAQAT